MNVFFFALGWLSSFLIINLIILFVKRIVLKRELERNQAANILSHNLNLINTNTLYPNHSFIPSYESIIEKINELHSSKSKGHPATTIFK